MNHEDSAQKVYIKYAKKCTRSSLIIQIPMSVITFVFFLCVLLFHFFGIWLTVKYKDFLIIQILHVFILLHKNKWKVQHVCCVLCCTFYRKFLVTIFNLGYKWYFVKTSFIISQLTISDWSEDVKSATCEPCL